MAATVLTQIVRTRKRVKLDWEAAVTHADAHGVSWGELVRPPPLPKKVMSRELTGQSVLSLLSSGAEPRAVARAASNARAAGRAIDLSALTSDLLPPPVGLSPGTAGDDLVMVAPDDIIEIEDDELSPLSSR